MTSRRVLSRHSWSPRRPGRARPLHKRPNPRRRRRYAHPLQPALEGGRRERNAAAAAAIATATAAATHLRRRLQSSPPPLGPLPPLTGTSCGVRAPELAAASAPPPPTSYWPSRPNPSCDWAGLPVHHRPGLRPTPACPSGLSLGAPTSAPPLASPSGLLIGGRAGRARPQSAAAYSRVFRAPRGLRRRSVIGWSGQAPARSDWLPAGVGSCDSFT